MPLDPQVQALLAEVEALGNPPLHTLSAVEARKLQRISPAVAEPPEPIFEVTERTIPGPGGELPIRVYRPSAQRPLPALVYFRGGGWMIGTLEYREAFCRRLANGAQCVVISVDYRNAPEHPFPAAADDALAATDWVASHAGALGIDPARVLVGGDSAGGNLATVTAIQARDRGKPVLAGQLLIYPITDHYSAGFASYEANATGYYLTRDAMIWFWNNYAPAEEQALSPLASPLRAQSLWQLPQTLVITAEYDPLRDEGEAYARRLAESGVATKLIRYDGLIHGFIGMTAALDRGREAVAEIVAELRTMLLAA